jgi:hypothetical protein
MKVYLGGKSLRLDPARAIGKGGEADVYDIGGGRALKLFKQPEHPDLEGDKAAQEAARLRLQEHQTKLRQFPSGLPPQVIRPEELATDGTGRTVLGYTMRLLAGAEALQRYGDRTFRASIAGGVVVETFRDLHHTVSGLHRAGVVIGDFNDQNVLVWGGHAWLIDADSLQFGPFLCSVYTERFLDPLLCDPALGFRPARSPSADSDWYAYTAMLLRSLLFVDPFGGVHKPKDPSRKLLNSVRPLQRISVLHPEVLYPRAALRWDTLPDDVLQHLHFVFEKDRRGPFPPALLDDLRFTRCTACGIEHARALCPHCSGAPPAAVREVTTVRGAVRSTRVFHTRGTILEATLRHAGLAVLAQEEDSLRREDGAVLLQGRLGPGARLRFTRQSALVGQGHVVAQLEPGGKTTTRPVDLFGSVPQFDVSREFVYRLHEGRLWRDAAPGPELVGEVLRGQTQFWMGPRFGFGLYRASELQVAFVFSDTGRGINDGVRLPRIRGRLVDATCRFADTRCFFLWTEQEGARSKNRCVSIRADGTLEAAAEAVTGDGSWLGAIHAVAPAGTLLFAATDAGIVRVETAGSRLLATRTFLETEPFVHSGCRLLPAPEGLYVIDRDEVRLLRMGA